MQKDDTNSALATAVVGLLGQVGCVTAVVILLALGAGLWLDARFGTRPLFTLALILASVPVTLYTMVRIVLGGMGRLNKAAGNVPPQTNSEEVEGGRNTDA